MHELTDIHNKHKINHVMKNSEMLGPNKAKALKNPQKQSFYDE